MEGDSGLLGFPASWAAYVTCDINSSAGFTVLSPCDRAPPAGPSASVGPPEPHSPSGDLTGTTCISPPPPFGGCETGISGFCRFNSGGGWWVEV